MRLILGALLILAVTNLSKANSACILWDRDGLNNAGGCIVEGEIEETDLCSTAPADSFIISMRGIEFNSNEKFENNCDIVNPSAYIWVPVEAFKKQIQPTLDNLEGKKFFGSVFEEESKYNSCNVDLTTAQCISKEVTVNATHILIEKLPIRYKLRDAIYSAWKNVTMLNKIKLETITQSNSDSSEKFLEQEVAYNYEPRIELEFPIRIVKNNLIQVYEDGKVAFHLDAGFRSSEIVQKKTQIINKVAANSMVTVDLEGVWGKTVTNFAGKLIIVYEDAPKAVADRIIDITGTKIVTEIIEISTKIVQLKKLEVETKPEEVVLTGSQGTTNIYFNVAPPQAAAGGVYPEFRPYFQFACVLFFGVCFYFAVDVTRVWIKYRREKREGKEYAAVNGS